MQLLSFVLALFMATFGASANQPEVPEPLRFALVPKSFDNPYFIQARDGCMQRAKELMRVECVYVGTPTYAPEAQAQLVHNLIDGGIDGLAISVADAKQMAPVIKRARAEGIPVITFDSDAPNSERQVYVGTDNRELGHRLGEELNELRPDGGTYAIITGGDSKNLAERVRGVRESLAGTKWREVAGSPLHSDDDGKLALRQMSGLMTRHPQLNAIISVGGWPMFETEGWKNFVDAHRKAFDEGRLLLLSADAVDGQLKLLEEGYATLLVAQQPFEMGARAMDLLLALKQGRSTPEIAYSGLEVVTRENVEEMARKR